MMHRERPPWEDARRRDMDSGIMKVNKKSSVLICAAFSALSLSCTINHAAGTFGKDAIMIPPPLPEEAGGAPQMEAYLFAQGDYENNNYVDGDGNIENEPNAFVQGGLLLMKREPLSESAQYELGVAASGWCGKIKLGEIDDSVDVSGLIPGEYAFYGGTGQFSGALRIGDRGGARIGLTSALSWEQGAYADFRKQVAVLEDEYGQHPYVNLSPGAWTHTLRGELSVDIPLQDDAMLRLTGCFGQLFDEVNIFNAAVYPFAEASVAWRSSRYVIFASYRMIPALGDSLSAGLMLSLH